jgi:hypothetical protein
VEDAARQYSTGRLHCEEFGMKQIIVQFLTGQDDDPITAGSQALQDRFKTDAKYGIRQNDSPIYTVRGGPGQPIVTDEQGVNVGKAGLRNAIGACDGVTSRMYLRGHGDWQNCKLGQWSAKDIDDLIDNGFYVGTISVTGCRLGRAPTITNLDPNDVRLAQSGASFAGQLAVRWNGCFGKLNAWVVDVTVKTNDTPLAGIAAAHQNIPNGRKIFDSAAGLSPRQPFMKITFADNAPPAWR